MAALLSDFLRSVAVRKWRWGETDCVMVLADWIKEARGFDPAEAWRGSYSSERECSDLLKRRRGLRRHLDDVLSAFGIARTENPAAGDIGLVHAPIRAGKRVRFGPVGAIYVGSGLWAVFSSDCGLVIAPLKMWTAWKVNG